MVCSLLYSALSAFALTLTDVAMNRVLREFGFEEFVSLTELMDVNVQRFAEGLVHRVLTTHSVPAASKSANFVVYNDFYIMIDGTS